MHIIITTNSHTLYTVQFLFTELMDIPVSLIAPNVPAFYCAETLSTLNSDDLNVWALKMQLLCSNLSV